MRRYVVEDHVVAKLARTVKPQWRGKRSFRATGNSHHKPVRHPLVKRRIAEYEQAIRHDELLSLSACQPVQPVPSYAHDLGARGRAIGLIANGWDMCAVQHNLI